MIRLQLLKILERGRKYVLLAIVWQWLGLVSYILSVGAIAIAISDIYYDKLDLPNLPSYLVVLILGVAGQAFFDKLYFDAAFEAGNDFKTQIRKRIYEKLIKIGASYRQHVSHSELMKMMSEDAITLEKYFCKYLLKFVYAILTYLTLFLCLTIISEQAAMLMIVFVLVIPILLIIVIHVFKRSLFKRLVARLVIDLITYSGEAVGLAIMLQAFLNNKIAVFSAIVFMFLTIRIFSPIRQMGDGIDLGFDGANAAETIMKFLNLREPISGNLDLDKEPIRISFNEMAYAYDGKKVLENISMLVPSGSLVAIVGRPGAGKSTIAKILAKQNRAYSGSIKMNGKELSSVSEDALMLRVASADKNSFLFAGTVKDNLLFAKPQATEKLLKNLLRIVNLWDELKNEGGLSYMLTSGGDNLSEGQKMRLVLVRALLKNPTLYIFDGITNDVDKESQKIIIDLVEKLSNEMGKTVIFLTDRPNDVVNCDKIFMLANGEISEQGTHQELMELNLEYARYFKEQNESVGFERGGE